MQSHPQSVVHWTMTSQWLKTGHRCCQCHYKDQKGLNFHTPFQHSAAHQNLIVGTCRNPQRDIRSLPETAFILIGCLQFISPSAIGCIACLLYIHSPTIKLKDTKEKSEFLHAKKTNKNPNWSSDVRLVCFLFGMVLWKICTQLALDFDLQ